MSTPVLLRDRHIRYWLRCAKTHLPQQYTSTDSNRTFLAFMIVSALDLLDILHSQQITPLERAAWTDWLYHCQLPSGGFRGFTGTDFGDEHRSEGNQHWDPANVAATFFALAALVVLGDDLGKVYREECLAWLPALQRVDGSFGETVGAGGKIEGGDDLRFCCCAAGIRYILQPEQGKGSPDIDVDGLERYIRSCQTYEGGFSEGSLREAHSGLTYCALAAMSFIGRLPDNATAGAQATPDQFHLMDCVRWILQRQTTDIEEEEVGDKEDVTWDQKSNGIIREQQEADKGAASGATASIDHKLIHKSSDFAGFNGRTNKVADTCYCFWNCGALAVLGHLDKIDVKSMHRYLLEKVQHIVGGFGKGVGEPPDVLHAYLGLATLALVGETGLKSLDPILCISHDATRRLSQLAWHKTTMTHDP